jgi:uncharacterized membrane protein
VDIAYAVVAALLSVMLVTSAMGKFQKQERVVDMIVTKLAVPASWLPLLGIAEVVGALGLLGGIAWRPLGIAAGVGVVLYFVGAVIAHLRANDAAWQVPAVLGAVGAVAAALAALSL